MNRVKACQLRDKGTINIQKVKKILQRLYKKIMNVIDGEEIVDAVLYDSESKEFLEINWGNDLMEKNKSFFREK